MIVSSNSVIIGYALIYWFIYQVREFIHSKNPM